MQSNAMNQPSQKNMSYPHSLLSVFAQAKRGSIKITGPNGEVFNFKGDMPGPNAEMVMKSWAPFDALVLRGDLGFGESYMDAQWTTPDLTAVLTFGLANTDVMEKYLHGRALYAFAMWARAVLRGNSITGSRKNIKAHYDLGNDFYKLWLDKSMTYSCALFKGDHSVSLEDAQQAKYARILDKLDAKEGAHILEIGCGWGGFAEAAAKRGLKCTSVTISDEQAVYAQERLAKQGLDALATIELKDYRKVEGQFDHIVSIGMFEHVGSQFWPEYFNIVRDRLKSGGTAMIQSITLDESVFGFKRSRYGFMEHYIFPGCELPSRTRFRQEAEAAGLGCEEQFVFGHDYAQTLRVWKQRFEAHLPEIRKQGYDDRFIRMWDFYLCCCTAAFDVERTSVMQAYITKKN